MAKIKQPKKRLSGLECEAVSETEGAKHLQKSKQLQDLSSRGQGEVLYLLLALF